MYFCCKVYSLVFIYIEAITVASAMSSKAHQGQFARYQTTSLRKLLCTVYFHCVHEAPQLLLMSVDRPVPELLLIVLCHMQYPNCVMGLANPSYLIVFLWHMTYHNHIKEHLPLHTRHATIILQEPACQTSLLNVLSSHIIYNIPQPQYVYILYTYVRMYVYTYIRIGIILSCWCLITCDCENRIMVS